MSNKENILEATINGKTYYISPGSRVERLILELKSLVEDSDSPIAIDYNNAFNKPSINGVELKGDKTSSDLGIVTASMLPVVPTDISAFNNDAGYVTASMLPIVPTDLSDLNNDMGYITEINVDTVIGKGANGGVAELDDNGKVPSSQLPSYVDDVVDGYYNDTDKKFYKESTYETEITGESGKIYISNDTDIQYRWNGNSFSALGGALVLGETASTAYRGDRGKIAYDDSQANKAAIGNLSNLDTTDKTNVVAAINEVSGSIPTKTSDLQNDKGYVTASTLPIGGVSKASELDNDIGFVTEADIPKKVSDLANDAGYLTNASLDNYTTDAELTSALTSYTPTSGLNQAIGKGTSGGVAELDQNGKIPSSQLPSYVDDVVEGYYVASDGKFYTNKIAGETPAEDTYDNEITGESDKIYIDVATSLQYRWTGSAFGALGGATTLGETSATAYRGDRGKIAYDTALENKSAIGTLANLATSIKTSIVDAINSLAAVAVSGDFEALINRPKQGVTSIDSIVADNYGIPRKSNDYSTDETIVGTWIDGRPVYQRAFSYTSPTYSSGGGNGSPIGNIGSNVYSIILFFGYMDTSDGTLTLRLGEQTGGGVMVNYAKKTGDINMRILTGTYDYYYLNKDGVIVVQYIKSV